MLESLQTYLAFPFVRYAFLVGILLSIATALLGIPLVLRRFALIGDGLSHVAFGAMAIASVLGLTNNLHVALPITILAAIFLLRGDRSSHLHGDAAVATLSVASLSAGYLLMNLRPSSSSPSGDVCSTLFGSVSILTLSPADVLLSSTLSLLVVLLFILGYRAVFSVTFDEHFAASSGVRIRLYNLFFAVVSAVMIVLAMRLVGALLVSALLIFPALAAMRLFRSFRSVCFAATLFSTLATTLGLLIAILAETPVGATIVGIDVLLFALASLLGKLTRHA